jgi:aspartate/methionine/tyrosine aminotransferase
MPGSKFAYFAFLVTLAKQDESIVLLKPYWTSYKAASSILGIKSIEV